MGRKTQIHGGAKRFTQRMERAGRLTSGGYSVVLENPLKWAKGNRNIRLWEKAKSQIPNDFGMQKSRKTARMILKMVTADSNGF